MDLQPDPIKENVSGKIKIETTGYDALKLREQYQSNFKQFKSDILPSTLTLADSIKTNNLTQYEKSFEVKVLSDGWTAVTLDGGLSAHFEHTVAITDNGTEILTRL